MPSTSQTRKVYELKVNVLDLEAQFLDMNEALKRATVNTLNTVGRAINKEIATDIKKNYNIKARTLKIGKTVRLIRADSRRRIPYFTISILKKGRGLALYAPERGKAGVGVDVKKRRKTVRGSFLIRSKQGKLFVARKGKQRRFILRTSRTGRRYVARESDFLHGPSVAQLYRRKNSFRMIDRVIKRDYKKELNKQFNNQFEKRR